MHMHNENGKVHKIISIETNQITAPTNDPQADSSLASGCVSLLTPSISGVLGEIISVKVAKLFLAKRKIKAFIEEM